MFASTVCSDQVHTFLWYISCLSSYGKLLVIISSWPKGCYVIEVSREWMRRDWTIVKNWRRIDKYTILHYEPTYLVATDIFLSKFDWHLIVMLRLTYWRKHKFITLPPFVYFVKAATRQKKSTHHWPMSMSAIRRISLFMGSHQEWLQRAILLGVCSEGWDIPSFMIQPWRVALACCSCPSMSPSPITLATVALACCPCCCPCCCLLW